MKSLFEGVRINMRDSIRMTIESLKTYGPRYDHWGIAWSGGKDSTALVTLISYLIDSGRSPKPKSLTVMYADTRMELLPLSVAAMDIVEDLRERGIIVHHVMAEMDKRFLPYILGRGVPPPNNNTLRWCTRQIKLDPMQAALKKLFEDRGKILMLTGVRQGESAIRDGRIAMSCGRDGAECGQGWFQENLKGEAADTLAPILHWRVCHVWEWLRHWAPQAEYGDWSTEIVADAYGGDEAEEINARTGCVGCPLASKDTALEAVIAQPRWAYLSPLMGLREIYRELREPHRRLRKPGGETRKDGTLVDNQHRMGPITLDTRRWALGQIIDIQDQINAEADRIGRPHIDMLNSDEISRINELIDVGTWPNRWSGDEPRADEPFDEDHGLELLWPTIPQTTNHF